MGDHFQKGERQNWSCSSPGMFIGCKSRVDESVEIDDAGGEMMEKFARGNGVKNAGKKGGW